MSVAVTMNGNISQVNDQEDEEYKNICRNNDWKNARVTEKFRIKLPAKMLDRSQTSIWSILKQFIGKELSKIAMPAAWCEPLSFLQRITENFYYSELLNRACDPARHYDACKRMELVAAYAVTTITSNIDRLSKPFNPLLGETYELIREDLGFRVLNEQVSHHPPITAFHVESTNNDRNWAFYGSINPKIKFWGKSIEVTPKGIVTVELRNYNETYSWQAVTCCVHNIIVGKLWFEYYGVMEIVCHQTGYKAVINFKPYSWLNKELHKFDGFVYDNKKNKIKALFGYWTHCVFSCDAQAYESYLKSGKPLPTVKVDENYNEVSANGRMPATRTSLGNENRAMHNSYSESEVMNMSKHERASQLHKTGTLADNTNLSNAHNSHQNYHLLDCEEIWRVSPRPPHSAEYYMFNYFTMALNELKDEFKDLLAPTDSRFRSDVKQLELGDLDGASQEKNRLEEKQRESRKTFMANYKGMWFKEQKHPHPSINEDVWLFTNKYWERDFRNCPDLY